MNSKVYKWCAVPLCKNTTIATPNKLFVYVPNKKIIRDMWLKLANRNPSDVVTNSSLYFCEDHFDLPSDMANYMQYHVLGSVSQVRTVPGCIPSKFACQRDRKSRTSDTTERPHIRRTRKMLFLEECEKQLEESSMVTEHFVEQDIGSGCSVPPAICSGCRVAIQASAPLYRCVQCAGEALLCALCVPAAHAHRRHCLMRMPSTRVHSILEGLFLTLQVDVNKLLYKEPELDDGQGASDEIKVEPGQSEEPMQRDEDELSEEESKPAPYVMLTGLQITQPSSPYDPLHTIFKEEDPLAAEDADESLDRPSPVADARPKRKARGSRKRKAESAVSGVSAGEQKKATRTETEDLRSQQKNALPLSSKAVEEASTSPLRSEEVSVMQDDEHITIKVELSPDSDCFDDDETQVVFIKTEIGDGDDDDQAEMGHPQEGSPQASQPSTCDDESLQIGEALNS